MTMVDALLPEFDHEMATTRKVLERLPDGKFAWKPHERSMTLGRLAGHITEIPGWVKETLTKDCVDVGGEPSPDMPATRAEVLARFDKVVAVVRPLLAGAADAHLMTPWTLKYNGAVILSMPRAAVLRGFVLSHLIHHRGQMSVYLRLNEVPVPAIYGPSADERG